MFQARVEKAVFQAQPLHPTCFCLKTVSENTVDPAFDGKVYAARSQSVRAGTSSGVQKKNCQDVVTSDKDVPGLLSVAPTFAVHLQRARLEAGLKCVLEIIQSSGCKRVS